MRQDVSFSSGGVTCRGWFYAPASKAPAIVMSHGFSAVKEQLLSDYAERFAAAGFAVLVFDYRYLGASDGSPRNRIVPTEQHDDLRAALSWLSARSDVDKDRLGMWGSSYSGGHTLVMAALDPRVKVAVAQVPAIDLMASILNLAGREGLAGLLGMFAGDHAARNAGQSGAVAPVVGPPGGLAVLGTPDSYAWFTRTAKDAPNWKNEVTLESVARMIEYAPGSYTHLISPKPLLIQAAEGDALIPLQQAKDAFARAGEPKRLDIFPGGHFDFYDPGPLHDRVANGAVEWFKRYL